MADGIGNISGYGNGYGNYGYGKYGNNGNGANEAENETQAPVNTYEDTQVDPAKVMDFLAQNNYFVNIANTPAQVEGVETDPTVADRVAGYMENFELIYGIIEDEFGPELAPAVMDFVMDRLMGMVD